MIFYVPRPSFFSPQLCFNDVFEKLTNVTPGITNVTPGITNVTPGRIFCWQVPGCEPMLHVDLSSILRAVKLEKK